MYQNNLNNTAFFFTIFKGYWDITNSQISLMAVFSSSFDMQHCTPLIIKRTALQQRLFVRLLQLTVVYFCPSNGTDYKWKSLLPCPDYMSCISRVRIELYPTRVSIPREAQCMLKYWISFCHSGRLMSKQPDILVRLKRSHARCLTISVFYIAVNI